jgi:hypothetical protein
MISLQEWSTTWGILIQYFIQLGCSYLAGKGSFRILWGLQAIPAIVLCVGMAFSPDLPHWLVDHDREDEVLEILANLHDCGDVDHDLIRFDFEETTEQVYFERPRARRASPTSPRLASSAACSSAAQCKRGRSSQA